MRTSGEGEPALIHAHNLDFGIGLGELQGAMVTAVFKRGGEEIATATTVAGLFGVAAAAAVYANHFGAPFP